ncbi:PLC-like phosphodiesterase [Xylariaceae sp. FL1019]|nr:PLC-like phosphodiesterase [Xylariaceae sp. FL1019]
MALRRGAWWLLAATSIAGTYAQSTETSSDGTTSTVDTSSVTETEAATPTGSYLSLSSQVSQGTTSSSGTKSGSRATSTDSATDSQVAQTTSKTATYLTGSGAATSTFGNMTRTVSSTSTSSSAAATSGLACNNYAEFCDRKYSNITEIACHNSPFVTANNLAANQEFDVTYQLDDGVRFLQAQIQWPTNDTVPHFCHTSCEILDAGPITNWLGQVTDWVASHPYDVITILLGNGNYSLPSAYVPYIEQSGITRYVYTPPLAPMNVTNWPTLSEMILSGKRVVMFMDYMANQTQYPWLLDEFSQIWETPFDPTNQTFPCDVQRPPDTDRNGANARMSLINHNLNIDLQIYGTELLVPARTELNVTNNVTGYGSLGLTADKCAARWGRAPNFLNVDYYSSGPSAGSVFEVAARLNNVTYNRACCGSAVSGAVKGLSSISTSLAYTSAAIAIIWALL